MASTKTSRARKTTAGARKAGAAPAPRAKRLPKGVAAAIHAALDKKALDVVTLDLRKADGFTDYFVICTGTSGRQIQAIADAVKTTLKTDFGERPVLAEGLEKSQWILLDYFDFVVHIFSPECRDFYALERLWGNAERREFSEAPA
jgi:ribosome-associated protein